LSPLAPAEDFRFVPDSQVQQVAEYGANFWHRELGVFFFPAGPFGVSGTTMPSVKVQCGGASRASREFHTRPIHIRLCHSGSPVPRTSDCLRLEPTWTGAHWLGHWTVDT
jgi:hypothetical protein